MKMPNRFSRIAVVIIAAVQILVATASPADAFWPWGKKLPPTGQGGDNINVIDAGGAPRGWRGDGNGVGLITDAYPDWQQFTPMTIVNSALTAGQANTSRPDLGTGLTPFPAYMHGFTWFRVASTSASNAATPWSVRFWGSTDGITYQPIAVTALTGAVGTPYQAAGHFFMTGNLLDTLKVVGRGNYTTGWLAVKDRGGYPVTLKDVVGVASADSAVGGVTITIEAAGRIH